jgi:hypothetical protein
MDRRNLPLQRSCSTNSDREATTNQANVLPEGSVRERREPKRYNDADYRSQDGRKDAISTDSDPKRSFHNEG